MIPVVVYVLLLALLAYVAILYASEAMLVTAAAGLVLLGIVYLYLIVLLICVRVNAAFPISMVESGDKAELCVRLVNRGLLFAGKVRVCFRGRNDLTSKTQRFHVDWTAAAGCSRNCYYELRQTHCGCWRYTVTGVRVYDLTGFFWLERKGGQMFELLVMPPIYETSILVKEQSRHFLGETEVYDADTAGPDVSELFAVRPFRDGDRLQNIHWKLTAKTEELMVRENSLPLGCPVVLLLELSGTKKRALTKRTDSFLAVAASLSSGLIGQKCSHYIAWYSTRQGDIMRMRIDREEDVYYFLVALSKEKMDVHVPSAHPFDIKEQYEEKYRAEYAVTMLVLDPELKIRSGDTLCTELIGEHIEQELGEVEFIV